MDNIIEFPSDVALPDKCSGAGTFSDSQPIPYIEPYPAPEYFVTELARAHVIGQVVRLIWSEPELMNERGDLQNVCACKLVIPREAIRALIRKLKTLLPPELPPDRPI